MVKINRWLVLLLALSFIGLVLVFWRQPQPILHYVANVDTNVDSPEPPIINAEAVPQTIVRGGSSVIRWQLKNADELVIKDDNSVIAVKSDVNEFTVSPLETTNYTLIATNSSGEGESVVSVNVTVTVLDYPYPIVDANLVLKARLVEIPGFREGDEKKVYLSAAFKDLPIGTEIKVPFEKSQAHRSSSFTRMKIDGIWLDGFYVFSPDASDVNTEKSFSVVGKGIKLPLIDVVNKEFISDVPQGTVIAKITDTENMVYIFFFDYAIEGVKRGEYIFYGYGEGLHYYFPFLK